MKATMTILASLVVLLSNRQASAAPIQWNVNGHFYERVLQTTTWQEAKDAADLLTFSGVQGHLVTITSADEQNFLIAQFPENLADDSFWLGGFQDLNAPDFSEPDGGWRWVTGEPFVYTNWHPIEPNNSGGIEDFLDTYVFSWLWNDITPSQTRTGFYVEYPTPEPSSFFLSTIGLFALAGVSLRCRKTT